MRVDGNRSGGKDVLGVPEVPPHTLSDASAAIAELESFGIMAAMGVSVPGAVTSNGELNLRLLMRPKNPVFHRIAHRRNPPLMPRHRQSRATGSERPADRPGRGRKAATSPRAFAMDPHAAPNEVECERFSDEVPALLQAGCAQRRYDLLAPRRTS